MERKNKGIKKKKRKLVGCCFDAGQSSPLCAGSRPPGRFSGASQCQMLPTPGPRKPVEATSYPLFLAASTGLGCSLEGPSCTPRLAFTSTRPSGGSVNVPRHPGICHPLPPPARQPPGLVTIKAWSLKEPLAELGGWGYWIHHEGGAIQTLAKMVGVFPHLLTTHLSDPDFSP